ncbi:MAG TPA: ABC transporter ATP-binding protein [Anaerolineaceae bacterium]|nr:ABC transporter ATP-binding protein [Anaerolineaceae bacterium]
MTNSAIRVEGISKRYPGQKDKLALDKISFNVPQGSLYGIIGPDGAGKTTLLRILSSVMLQSSGKASVLGFDTRRKAEEIRKLIGYMPQEFSQYPDLNLIENLNFFADIQGVSKAQKQERIEKMLALTNLSDFRQRAAGNLSGGMKKKLALSCAMVHNPQVLILDEPTTGVDPVSRAEFWSLLSTIVIDGVTVLISTPYMDEAERCSMVGILYDGKVLKEGTPEALTHALPFNIIEVKAKPRKQMREVVSQTDGILSWNPVGDRLRLSVPATKERSISRELERSFRKQKLDLQILRSARKTMEDVFVTVVEDQEGQKS